MCEGDDAYGGGVDVADVRSSKSRLHVSPRVIKAEALLGDLLREALAVVWHAPLAFVDAVELEARVRQQLVRRKRGAWTMAMCRQRPTEMCLFFLWTFNTFEGSLSCNIFSYALRQRLLSPLVNTIIKR